MRMRPLFLALIVLLFLTGGALGFWVMDSASPHNAPAPRPQTGAVHLAPETDAPAKPAPLPLPDPEVIRPADKPQPAPAAKPPAPAPASPAPEDLVTEIKKLKDRDPSPEEIEKLRELAAQLAEVVNDPGEEVIQPAPAFTFKATIRGSVVDHAGTGVAGADVLVAVAVTWVEERAENDARRRRAPWAPGPAMAKSDSLGNFVVNYSQGFPRDVRAIKFTLNARDAGHSIGEGVEFSLNPDETKEGVRLALPATGAITGRVVDATGLALAGARVRAMMVEAERSGSSRLPSMAQGGGHGRWFETDARGEFRITGLLPGTYMVYASHDGYLPPNDVARAVVAAGLDFPLGADISMKLATSLKVTLHCPGRTTAGQVVTASFFDAAGRRIRQASARVDGTGATLFVNAPVETVTVQLAGAFFETTGQIGCVVRPDMHNDMGTVSVTARELPARGVKDADDNAGPRPPNLGKRAGE
ncbi:MAG: carboxypeptidase regulatory-like domain-containing protein [Planctomycetes bacterium]|nr:carboxypeptidase regulatory-like domain-containing protein [Planctomycetota bacterium]